MNTHIFHNVTTKTCSLQVLSQVSLLVICILLGLSQNSDHSGKHIQAQFQSEELKDFLLLEDEVYLPSEERYEAYLDIFVRNADLSQPLLQSKDNALPKVEFQALQDCLRDHPMRFHNVNDDNTFNGTRGFLLSFNEQGIENMTNSEMFGCLSPYFEKFRLPNTNAWVLNMVWADVPDFERELTIQRHTDDGE